jgi:histone-lysine N-methyltransferase SUV39H
MTRIAHQSSVDKALTYIRAEYVRRLEKVPGKRIHLINLVDKATPSLRFRYISEYVLREGVYRASAETQQGCTQCSPHMGRNIGCEYTKKCDCLEYAAVDESRLDEEEKREYREALDNGESTLGFPKKFPYFAEGTKRERTGCLVPFYLNSRRPIYECNDRCRCGPHCRNKNVQFGRQVEVEIFRAGGGRGWGLRCKVGSGRYLMIRICTLTPTPTGRSSRRTIHRYLPWRGHHRRRSNSSRDILHKSESVLSVLARQVRRIGRPRRIQSLRRGW